MNAIRFTMIMGIVFRRPWGEGYLIIAIALHHTHASPALNKRKSTQLSAKNGVKGAMSDNANNTHLLTKAHNQSLHSVALLQLCR